jgi:hypothetical protein
MTQKIAEWKRVFEEEKSTMTVHNIPGESAFMEKL